MININHTNNDKYILDLLSTDIFNEFINIKKPFCMLETKYNFINIDTHNNFLHDNNSSIEEKRKLIKKFKNKNYENNIDYKTLCNPFGIEKVVFSGGGTRGIIYIGSLIALYKLNTLFYLNTFIGTSAGALTALFLGCITPIKDIYENTKTQIINNIDDKIYYEALQFFVKRLWNRPIATFYDKPSYSFFGLLNAMTTLMKDNSLYDNEKSGFNIWIALICKKICKIMGNTLDEKIIIKYNGSIIDENINDELIDTCKFDNYIIERFFTFQEYYEITGKSIIITGTQTKNIKTVYYTYKNDEYKNLDILTAILASMSIPWIFKAPIINNCYHFDGGLYDNYPISINDIKNDKIISYDNTIFGILIDNKDTIINVNDVITELWIIYNGFNKITHIDNLQVSNEFIKLSELFFEIKTELSNLLFAPKELIRQYIENESIYNINNLFDTETQYKIVINNLLLKLVDYNIKNLDDVFECSINHGKICDELYKLLKQKNVNTENYNFLLNNILVFYDLKYKLYTHTHTIKINTILEKIYNILKEFSTLYKLELAKISNPEKNINNSISMLENFIINIIGNNINIEETQHNNYSYQNIINYFYNTSMNDILCKYFNIVNNKVCNDNFNVMRTIIVNTFDCSVLDFNMTDEIRIKLIYEGYTKTINYFSNILHLMKLTGKIKTEKYINSYETLYNSLFNV